MKEGHHVEFDSRAIEVDPQTRALFMARDDEAGDSHPEAMLEAVRERGAKSVFVDFVLRMGGRPSRDAILAAIATTIAWGPLVRKRISRLTAETLPWYLRLYGVMVGASIPARTSPVGIAAWHLAGRALRLVDDGRPVLPGHDRQEADAPSSRCRCRS